MQLTEIQKDDIQTNKDIAAFSYIWIFSVIIMWTRRDSQFVQFHARQAVMLFILSIIIYVIPIPKFHYLNVFTVAGMIAGFINANMWEYYEMPLVSDLVKNHITVGGSWNYIKKKANYCGNFIKRVFKKGPKVVVESSVDTISKIRGIDVLNVNKKVKELEQTVQSLEIEKNVLHLQLANLEIETLAGKYLRNLNFVETTPEIQSLTNEIIKKINLKDLKLSQEDFAQYIVFRNQAGAPICLMGNFSPDKLMLFVSNSSIKNAKDYSVNFNSWHGIQVRSMERNVKKLLEYLR